MLQVGSGVVRLPNPSNLEVLKPNSTLKLPKDEALRCLRLVCDSGSCKELCMVCGTFWALILEYLSCKVVITNSWEAWIFRWALFTIISGIINLVRHLGG